MLLIAAVHHICFEQPLGHDVQIADGVYVTTDRAKIERLVSHGLRSAMGGNEYQNLYNTSVAIYMRGLTNEPDPHRGVQLLTAWLQSLRAFFMSLWLIKDNAVNCELGFLEHDVPQQGRTVASNFIAALFSQSDGTMSPCTLTHAELLEARDHFTMFFLPLILGIVSEGNGTTQLWRPLPEIPSLVNAKGVHRLSRLVYFLTHARCAEDVGVKVSAYMTCLEVLFSTEALELTHKLAQRMAFFLCDRPDDRLIVYRMVKKAYSVRSKVVHGSVLSDRAQRELPGVAAQIDQLLRRVVHKVATNDEARRVVSLGDAELEEHFTRLTMGL